MADKEPKRAVPEISYDSRIKYSPDFLRALKIEYDEVTRRMSSHSNPPNSFDSSDSSKSENPQLSTMLAVVNEYRHHGGELSIDYIHAASRQLDDIFQADMAKATSGARRRQASRANNDNFRESINLWRTGRIASS